MRSRKVIKKKSIFENGLGTTLKMEEFSLEMRPRNVALILPHKLMWSRKGHGRSESYEIHSILKKSILVGKNHLTKTISARLRTRLKTSEVGIRFRNGWSERVH